MRIALVNHTFAPTNGQGCVNRHVADAVLDAGGAVTLIGDDFPTELAGRPGVECRPVTPSQSSPTRLLKDLSFGRRATGVVRRSLKEVDLVVANGGMLFCSADVNLCHFVHAAWIDSPEHPLRSATKSGPWWRWYQYVYSQQSRRWERDAYRRAGRVVAVSELVKRQLQEAVGLTATRIDVVENGVDLPESNPTSGDRQAARRLLGVAEDDFIILFAGDLRTPRKNLDVLLRALPRLPERVVLVAAGGYEGGPYPRAIESAGLGGRVRLLGMRDDLRRLYAGADVFALLSHYEPFGLVVTEAMAAGVPVVTALTVGAASAVAAGEAGVVIDDPHDEAALASAMNRLLDEPEALRQMSHSALSAARELSWERIKPRYLRVFNSVLEEQRGTTTVGRRDGAPS
ncbi:D-inositol 3-phosphate glycosyltransferase [Botrimarina colliarenosi]|uniref:D-inositol 3-phosphate glycosyltransferase n=1 Tax=Botrimarina colliarenosi TaxID=2528001 RepID=A0A5C6AIB1_9BACT|nr:glycosyltransferase family 4 protein [Botrimarina colliarenosi]TWT97963.1 D-inositol 3-phosphate glycosyltransferase [Botrimarina colliarenosi]